MRRQSQGQAPGQPAGWLVAQWAAQRESGRVPMQGAGLRMQVRERRLPARRWARYII